MQLNIEMAVRYFLGANLLLSSTTKLLDMQSFADIVKNYQVFSETQYQFLPILGLILSLVEFLLAVVLLTEDYFEFSKHLPELYRYTVWGSIAFHLFFIMWNSVAIMRGLRLTNCGCYGVYFPKRLTPWTVVLDTVYLLLHYFLLDAPTQQKLLSF